MLSGFREPPVGERTQAQDGEVQSWNEPEVLQDQSIQNRYTINLIQLMLNTRLKLIS